MAYSSALYQPSILELAQEGNCRALTYWMNSLLGPQGVQIQVLPGSNHFLKILINFRRPKQREACLRLRERLVRFICYRLWTLNSEAIRGVRIVARMAGDPRVLWQLSIRINSPVMVKRRRAEQSSLRQMQVANQLRFRVFRSLFMSSITAAGFFWSYGLFYAEMGRLMAGKSAEAAALSDGGDTTDQTPATPRLPEPPERANFTVPESLQRQVISQVDLPDDKKVIALTFDDGPQAEATAQVLDVLKQHNVQATFFVSGENVRQVPTLVRRMVLEGHAIGNRGWHRNVENGRELDPKREVDDTAKLIHAVAGAKTALFRPAGGQLDSNLVAHAQQQNYAITLWSVDSQDTLVAAPIVLDNVLRNVRPGRIVLMHDGRTGGQSATIQALPQLIVALQQQGYRFVTVPELLEIKEEQTKLEQQKEAERQEDSITLPLRRRSVAVAWVE